MNSNEFSRYLSGIGTCLRCGEGLLPQGGHADQCYKEPKWFTLWSFKGENFISFSCMFWEHFALGRQHKLNPDLYSALMMCFGRFDTSGDNYSKRRLEVYNFAKEWFKSRPWWKIW